MLGTFIVKSAGGTVVLFTLVGFSWATTNWIPYAMLGAEIEEIPAAFIRSSDGPEDENDGNDNNDGYLSPQTGRIYGLHNLAICGTQIAMTLVMWLAGVVMRTNSMDDNGSVILWVLRAGGVCALMAMFCTMWVEVPAQSRGSVDDEKMEYAGLVN